uniref:Serine/threonine-protein kinase RIO1 n=1 Tax=Trichuris muris TaxID=70415 RepID=A0A5S6Q9T8_TRIMR
MVFSETTSSEELPEDALSSSTAPKEKDYEDEIPASLHAKIRQTLDTHEKAQEDKRYRSKDKVDHATVESVLDPRTKVILFKLTARGYIGTLSGCISTGKEANVYHASSDKGDLAVKVYQTSILTFKDRDRYLMGDFRLRYGYCRHNSRKMVNLWAMKEYRNMCRLHKSSVLCPKPITCCGNVFIMSLLGLDGVPSPQLKEVQLPPEEASRLYSQVCLFIREMYQVCKLVHADLSEYNIIYNDNNAYIIDVSQAVEIDHPNAITFLYRDCLTMTKYFMACGIPVLNVDRLFEFAVSSTIEVGADKSVFDLWLQKEGGHTVTLKSENEAGIVFQTMLIERSMRNLNGVDELEVEDLLNGIKDAVKDQHRSSEADSNCFGEEGSNSSDSSCDSSELADSSDLSSGSSVEEDSDPTSILQSKGQSAEKHGSRKTLCPRKLGETPEMKKIRKKAVKEMQRNNRLSKVPKHVKKRRKKLSKANAKRK